jgi:hypothetical protein
MTAAAPGGGGALGSWRERKGSPCVCGGAKWWGPPLEGEMEGLQEWRVGGEIWRGMQNGGPFEGPAGVDFFHQTSKFWSRVSYIGPCWSCSKDGLKRRTIHSLMEFFSNYTIYWRHSQHTHTHPYEYTHANPTPRSIFEDCAGKSSRLT